MGKIAIMGTGSIFADQRLYISVYAILKVEDVRNRARRTEKKVLPE